MPDRLTLRLNVDDASPSLIPAEPTGVGGLPTPFRIEGCFLEEHVRVRRLACDRENVSDDGIGLQPVVTDEAVRARSRSKKMAAG